MTFERKKVGEDWTDSDKDLATSGTLASGDQTITGDSDVSGTITGAVVKQGANAVLDVSDLDTSNIIGADEIANTGPSVPSSPFAGMLWFDSGNNLFRVRNEANSDWLDIWDTANDKPIIANLSAEILTAMLIDECITASKLEDDVITNNHIADGALTPAKTGFRGALIYITANKVLQDSSNYLLEYTAQNYDTDDFWDNSVNPERLTVPAGATKIEITGQFVYNLNATTTGRIRTFLYKNGSKDFAGGISADTSRSASGALLDSHSIKTPPLSVVEGDYFHIEIYWQDDGGSATGILLGDSFGSLAWLSIKVLE